MRVSSSTKNNALSKQRSTKTTEIYPRTPTRKSKVNPLGQTAVKPTLSAKRKAKNVELRR